MTELQKFALEHKPIFWDVSTQALEKMDDSTILERFFCYGDWQNYKRVEKIIGKDRAKEIFMKRAFIPRTNLREETINLFTYYFHVTPPQNRPLSRAM